MDRRILMTAALTALLGAAPAVAQSAGNAGNSNYGSGTSGTSSTTSTSGTSASENARRNAQSSDQSTGSTASTQNTDTSATGATTQSGTTASQTDTSSATTIGSATTTDTSTAGGATTMTGRDSNKLGWMERRFVTKAADSGTTEINLAKLAAERATNPEVKSFAQKLVDDHTKVGEELKQLAGQKNVKLDEEDLGSDRAHKRLSKKSGMEFDQEFIEHMVEMHESDVKMFEKASEDAKDAELKSFAAKHVDHLRQHLQQAQSLRSSLMPTGRSDDTGDRDSGRGASWGTRDRASTSDQSSTSTTDTQSSAPGSSNTDSSTNATDSTRNDLNRDNR